MIMLMVLGGGGVARVGVVGVGVGVGLWAVCGVRGIQMALAPTYTERSVA